MGEGEEKKERKSYAISWSLKADDERLKRHSYTRSLEKSDLRNSMIWKAIEKPFDRGMSVLDKKLSDISFTEMEIGLT